MRKNKEKQTSCLRKLLLLFPIVAMLFTLFLGATNANASRATDKSSVAPSYSGFKIDIPLSSFPIFGTVKGEPLYHESFHTKSDAMAWCINYDKFSPTASSNTTKKHKESSMQFHAIMNGYPLRTAKSLGLESEKEGLGATQIAVWIASGNFSEGSVDYNSSPRGATGGQKTSLSQRLRVKKAVHQILTDAKKDKRGQGTPDLTVKKSGETTTNEDGSKTVNYKVNITKNYTGKVTLDSLSAPSGTTITQNGKTLSKGSSVNTKDKITVNIPASGEDTKTKLGFKAKIDTWTDASWYTTKDSGNVSRQNVLVQSTVDPGKLTLEADTTESTPATNGDIAIHKVGSHGETLENIKFDLLDKSKKVINSGVTSVNGNLTFKNLKPDTYYVREADTDSEHEVNHELHDVSFTAEEAENDQTPDITIGNDEITDNPYIRSIAGEVGTGSRHIDAKNETLKDELSLEQLDGTHNYRVVDTLMDLTTGEEAKIDGKSVTQTANVTAGGKSGEKVEERVTMNFDTANFKGLQGHKYSFQAKVYRVSNWVDDDGKLLATEASLGDCNQTIFVEKPVVTTQVRSAIGENSTDETQNVNPYSKSHWIDNVTANYLVKDHNYSLHLKAMIKDSSGNIVPLKISGKEVTADKTFTADNTQMNLDVDFENIDTRELQGKDIVIYTDLTPKEEENNQLATHNDFNDKKETIHITEPKILSKLLVDNDKYSNPNHSSRIIDRVNVTDVAPNQPLEISTIISDKDKKAIVTKSTNANNVNGKQEYDYLVGKIKVTPTSDNFADDVQIQKLATGETTDNSNALDKLKVDISSPSSRRSINKLNAINSGDVNIDANKSAQDASNEEWKKSMAGKLGYEPADNETVYDIDTTSLKGQSLVAFDDLNFEDDTDPASTHADPDNTDQTVRITEPKIFTEAKMNNHQISNPKKNAFIQDKVRYEDVAVGHELDISGLAVDQKTGQPISIKNQNTTYYLQARRKIIPSTANGSVVIPFQEVTKNGEEVNNNSGSENINKDNVDKIKVENVKDDRDMQDTNKSVSSIKSDGSTNMIDALEYLHKVIDYTNTLVYQSNVGMPKDLVTAITRLTKVIGDGSNVNITDLKNAVLELDKVNYKEVTGGTLVTNEQYEAYKNNQSTDNTTDLGTSNTNTSNNGASDSTSNDVSNNKVDYSSESSSLERVKNNHIQTTNPAMDSDVDDPNSAKYAIDTRTLRGKTITLFEDVTSSQDTNNTSIVSEANLNSTDQSMRVTDPSMQTMHTIGDEKTVYADKKNAKIKDKVQFKDFAPNEKITLTAVDMDKGTKEAAKINNSFIFGRKTFTPNASNGTVNVFMTTRKEEPEAGYMVKLLQSNGLYTELANTTQQANSTKTSEQLLNMNNGSVSDSTQTNSNSNGQTDTNDTNTVVTNNNGDNSYESQADNSVGTDNVDDHVDTSETSTDLSWLDKLSDGQNDPTNREFNWTCFETAQADDGTVITEHKDMSSADQTVTIKTPTNSNNKDENKPNININNQNTNGNNDNKSNSSNGNNDSNGGSTNGGNGSSQGGNGSGNSQSGSSKTGNGTASNGSSTNPQLVQTGANNKLSQNNIYNFFFGWVNKKAS